MAARRRTLAPALLIPEKLTDRRVSTWLTPREVDALQDLLARSAATTGNEAWKLQREAWGLFHGAWENRGTADDLVAQWAEDRRQRACAAWVREQPGRTMADLGPFDDHLADL